MGVPLDIPVPDTHQVISFSNTCNLHTMSAPPLPYTATYISQAVLLHPHHHHRGSPPHTQPIALILLLGQLHSPGRCPVVLGREHSLRSKGVEEVGDMVVGEVGVGQGELELGGGEDGGWL